MGKMIIMMLFAMTLFLLSNGIDVKAEVRKTLLEVDRKLKLVNKPAVKSIKSEDGDIIDCVDIYKQPAFDHPALRNHTIQMRPTLNFTSESLSTKNESSRFVLSQTWERSGNCPEGTIPIRRIRRKDILRADSLEHFGRDGPQTSSIENTTNDQSSRFIDLNDTKIFVNPPPNHSAAFLITTGYIYESARGDINIWTPRVESWDEYTTAQIWLKDGPGSDFESMEAGWAVNPKLYGNAQPRLFARWTLDGYEKTGCFDHTCSGFVQTSRKLAFGATIPVSHVRSTQTQISVRIHRDPKSDNWWLHFNEEAMGYWPGAILKDLKDYVGIVQWGGDVYSKNVKKSPHTATAMGSGRFAEDVGYSCYIKNVRIIHTKIKEEMYPEWIGTDSEEPKCYTAYNYQKDPASDPTFYFGGPGRNANCP